MDRSDKGSDPADWQETSASTIYVYTLSKAVRRGYIPKSYSTVACKGYSGVLTQLSADIDSGSSLAR